MEQAGRMGTVLGALAGAAFIIVVGRVWKGRDFLGLVAAFFFLALIVGLMGNLLAPGVERSIGAELGVSPDDASLMNMIAHGLIAFMVVYVPGFIFVALAKSANRDN